MAMLAGSPFCCSRSSRCSLAETHDLSILCVFLRIVIARRRIEPRLPFVVIMSICGDQFVKFLMQGMNRSRLAKPLICLNARIIILMHKTSRADLKSPDDPRVLQFAKEVRMRMLQFRFEHYRSLSIPKVPTDVQLSSRPLDLYRALALPFGADREFCGMLAHFIVAQAVFQPSLLSPAQASAVRVLHVFIHACRTSGGFKLSGLTEELNLDLASRGERTARARTRTATSAKRPTQHRPRVAPRKQRTKTRSARTRPSVYIVNAIQWPQRELPTCAPNSSVGVAPRDALVGSNGLGVPEPQAERCETHFGKPVREGLHSVPVYPVWLD